MADEFEPSVQVGIFATSSGNSVQDHRKLRDAIEEAKTEGTVTWVKNPGGAPVAAIVPWGIAEIGRLAWDEITATIGHLTEDESGQAARAGAGSRYEVVLDYTDGGHRELEAHFRLVELTATRPPPPVRQYIEALPPDLPAGRYEVAFSGYHTFPGSQEREMRFRYVRPVPSADYGTEAARLERERRALYPDELGEHPDLPPRDIVTTYRGGYAEHRTRSGRLLTDAELAALAEEERRLHPLKVMHVGSASGNGPEFEVPVRPGRDKRLAELLARIIELSGISPRVLGIADAGAPLEDRISQYLRG
jgi:hypothetical protein